MTSRDDWDAEEKDALAGLEDQLAIMRRRQAADPPVDLVAAARAEAIPEQSLDQITGQRVWARIARDLPQPQRARSPRWIAAALAAAATITLAVVVNRNSNTVPPTVTPAPGATRTAPAPPALEFTKPDVKLSPAALTWRGNRTASPFMLDLKPAIDAYNNSAYADAEPLFASLTERYPRSVEAAYFLGVVRMLRGNFDGAIAPLGAAVALNEPTFADDSAWFLAVAEQRSGKEIDALRRLDALCAAGGTRAQEACAAQKLVTAPR
jgi:TolA-binding protein